MHCTAAGNKPCGGPRSSSTCRTTTDTQMPSIHSEMCRGQKEKASRSSLDRFETHCLNPNSIKKGKETRGGVPRGWRSFLPLSLRAGKPEYSCSLHGQTRELPCPRHPAAMGRVTPHAGLGIGGPLCPHRGTGLLCAALGGGREMCTPVKSAPCVTAIIFCPYR